ncbi:MAG: class I SAM-dependent rRNA methyltransferase [Planctomycetota bacterium]
MAPRTTATVRLKTDRIGRRPWIYRKMVERPEGVGDGELVAVVDKQGRPVGRGFYNSRSQIGLRLISRKVEDDPDFIRRALRDAVYLRREVLDLDHYTDAYRVVNSEGDGLSGLIVDRYAGDLVIEIFSLGFWKLVPYLSELLRDFFDGARVHVRADERVQRDEGFRAPPPERGAETVVHEHGVLFHVDLSAGHKTGFFCDQRDNRHALAQHVRNANVLDLCCYTGGFALYARRLGGAGRVLAVDLDEKAIEVAKRNARLNDVTIEWHHADVFDFMRREETRSVRWDVIVLDPPKLVSHKAERARGEAKYRDLNAGAISLLKNNGLLLTCSCSGLVSEQDFLALLQRSAARLQRDLQILSVAGPAPDHPFVTEFPEGRYLKAVLCAVRQAR